MIFSKPGYAFKFLAASFIAIISVASCTVLAGDYAGTQQVRAFAQRMAEQHGFEADKVAALLGKANRQQSILDAIARPAEKSKPWYQYREIFLDDQRISGGVAFWRQHQDALARAEETFGVSPEIIVAIIGVETRYGSVTGSYRVLDALATLGFDYPPRADFFSRELEQFLLLTREQQQNPLLLKGSYAGAMGYGQFMPSSYRAYATDFDGDQSVDIWTNPVDAIGSVANYFKVHGWQAGAEVMIPARVAEDYAKQLVNQVKKPHFNVKQLSRAGFDAVYADPSRKAIPLSFESREGQEFWLGFQNFYVITRYNRSPLYARAVWELSREIADRRQTVMQASKLVNK